MERFETFEISVRRIASNGDKYLRDSAWVSLRWTGGEALGTYWFLLSTRDIGDVLSGRVQSVNDIAHNARVFGDQWTFYDLDFPAKRSGEMTIKFESVTIPRLFLRAVHKWALKVLPTLDDQHYEHRITLSKERRRRIVENLSRSTGEAVVDMNESATKLMEAWLKTEAGNLLERVEYLKVIAKNNTSCRWEKATVHLSKDWDGFYFDIRNSRGHRVMNGGIVNHAKDGERPNWSIHT